MLELGGDLNMSRVNKLGEESVGVLLFKFSLPAIVGMIVNAFYNIVDRAFIGRVVGALAISGLSITFPIVIINMAFGMLIGIGAGANVSIKLGEKNNIDAEKILGNAFALIIIVSLFVTLMGFLFMEPLLKSFGASENILIYAKEYISIILLGVILQNIGFGLNNIIRAEGNPKIAMFTMLIGGILNIFLDYLFIYIFNWGIKGAAFATIISQGVNTIWVLSYFVGENSTLRLKLSNLKLKKSIILSIIAIGMSPFVMQIASSAVTIILNKQLAIYGGDLAIGAMGIINSIAMFILMPIFGINQGSQPIIGYNYGSKAYIRVKEALLYASMAATTIAITGFLCVELIPTKLIGFFNKSSIELTEISVTGVRTYLMMLPIIGFQIVSTNYFQAVGKAKISMFLSLSRQVIVLIPLLLILPSFLKLKGIWISAPISDLISSILTAVFILKEMKKLNNSTII